VDVIDISGVTKIYRRSHLGRVQESVGVSGLSMTVGPGEVFGLLGLNGAGKTTTIKLMLGLLCPTSGRVRLFGADMPDMSVLRRVGYLPEAAYLNKYLTGRETLELFGRIAGFSGDVLRRRVDGIIERVGMRRAAGRRLADYSKGMLQRISIAQALLHDPDLLIFDEPITGLDPLAVKEIRQLILWLKQQGKTVFFSSHNISEVERVCDRIGIIVNGTLAALVPQADWAGREGHLEELFITTVAGSAEVGSLSFMS